MLTLPATRGAEIQLSRSRLYLGESLVLQIRVSDSATLSDPDLSALTDVRVQLLSRQPVAHSSVSIIQGQRRIESFHGRVYAYQITPLREGRQRLGPIRFAGADPETDPGPEIDVVGITPQDHVRVALDASRTLMWIGDTVEIGLRVAIRLPPNTPAGVEPLSPDYPPRLDIPYLQADSLPGLQGPDIAALLQPWLSTDPRQAALTINDFTLNGGTDPFAHLFQRATTTPRRARFRPDRQWIEPDQHRWVEYLVRTTWRAEAEGLYTFGPVLFKGPVAVAANASGQFSEWRDIFTVGAAVTIRVVPPPSDDRPDNFFGAVGTRMSADLEIDPPSCRLGDPVHLRLRISGDIRLDRLRPPPLGRYPALTSIFRIHDETARSIPTDQGIEFIYTLRPMIAGTLEIPPLELPWFDRSAAHYTVAATRPIPFQVLPARRLQVLEILRANDDPDAAARPAATLPPVPAAFSVDPDGWQTVTWHNERRWFWLAALGPAHYLLIMAVAALPAKRRALLRYIRRRCALRALQRRLGRLADSPALPAAAAARAIRNSVQRFFEDAFDLRSDCSTPDELWRSIAAACPHALPSSACREILERCHHLGFTGALSIPFDPGREIAGLLRELTKLAPPRTKPDSLPKRRIGRAAAVPATACLALTAFILMPLGHRTTQSDASIRRHLWQEANAMAGNAVERDDFQIARDRYQALLTMGAHNAPLYYNYGTLCLEMEDFDAAIAALRRAERMAGSTREIRHNQRLAMQQRAAEATVATGAWWRFAMELRPPRLPASARLRLGVIIFLAVWTVLSVRYLRGRRRSALTRF